MARLPIRAIFFDAVGTLLHPIPSAAQVYAQVGRAFGSHLGDAEIVARFRVSFARQEELDRARENLTSEAREVERWRAIVAEVLDDVTDAEGCFQTLYDHFAFPSSWALEPETGLVLSRLARDGYLLGLASNFDHRLHLVTAGFKELEPLQHVVVSASVGHRKPSRMFFAELCRRTGLPPGEILMVGDDPYNDVAGAEAAGLRARPFAARTGALVQLREWLRGPGEV